LTELTKRILFAMVGGPIFIAVTWLGGYYFATLMLILGLLIQHEMVKLMDLQGFRPNAWIAYFSLVLLMLGVLFPDWLSMSFMGVAVLQIAVDTLDRGHRQMYRTMSTFYCTLYPALGILSFVAIREMGPDPAHGFLFMLILLFMIWGNDTLAFFVGKNIGRHLMAQHLSPKKTWEGFVGGFIGSALGLWAATSAIILEGFHWGSLWPLILVISIVGPIGDLAASKLKRAAGVKDTSNLFPGHGGVLDRFDSLLLAAPVLFLYLRFFS
jgi:phosphatidate cytidylyltransferase